jgi:hypothetical protein
MAGNNSKGKCLFLLFLNVNAVSNSKQTENGKLDLLQFSVPPYIVMVLDCSPISMYVPGERHVCSASDRQPGRVVPQGISAIHNLLSAQIRVCFADCELLGTIDLR